MADTAMKAAVLIGIGFLNSRNKGESGRKWKKKHPKPKSKKAAWDNLVRIIEDITGELLELPCQEGYPVAIRFWNDMCSFIGDPGAIPDTSRISANIFTFLNRLQICKYGRKRCGTRDCICVANVQLT